MDRFYKLSCLALLALSLNSAAGEVECGPVHRLGGFGPFDYRDKANLSRNLPIVEQFHFTQNVENLIRGESTHVIGGDLSYTLRAFPNHHRALNAIVRLAAREKTDQPRGSSVSVNCWFDRAIRWREDDGTVRMLYANYLVQAKKLDEAGKQYQAAEKLLPNSPNVAYNYGLYHFERKDYDKAREYAKKAYAKGFPLDGLKRKLMSVGKWS
jgi:tetratricopeptide (TPR) repeat protein